MYVQSTNFSFCMIFIILYAVQRYNEYIINIFYNADCKFNFACSVCYEFCSAKIIYMYKKSIDIVQILLESFEWSSMYKIVSLKNK